MRLLLSMRFNRMLKTTVINQLLYQEGDSLWEIAEQLSDTAFIYQIMNLSAGLNSIMIIVGDKNLSWGRNYNPGTRMGYLATMNTSKCGG